MLTLSTFDSITFYDKTFTEVFRITDPDIDKHHFYFNKTGDFFACFSKLKIFIYHNFIKIKEFNINLGEALSFYFFDTII